VELGILGPLDVRLDGVPVPVRRGIPCRILTLLAARSGDTITTDTLAELVWAGQQPGNPTNALQVQISHLRAMVRPLDTDGRSIVQTVAGGYCLDVPRDAVDAARFEDLVGATRRLAGSVADDDLTRAVELSAEALGLWRGEPLADAAGHSLVAADVGRLHELRVTALEARGDALLALGRHGELLAELQHAIADHPLHERFHAQLIVALYRSGRHVEALRAAANVRRTLSDEIGVEPGPELVLLEHQVLTHAAELTRSPPAGAAAVATGAPAATAAASAPMATPLTAGPPPLARYHVARPRVGALLDDTDEASLVVVCAPAGAGKTAALSEWLAGRHSPAGWVTLDEAHDDPAVFWPAVAAALGLPDATDHRDRHAVVRTLATAREAGGSRRLLVLDDYHAISNAALHADIDAMLSAPTGLRLVIGTRHDPPLRLAALRAGGQLREIRYDDLRFDAGESHALVDRMTGVELSAPDLTRLLDQTAGWAVGLQLAAVSLQHHPDPASFVAEFAGDDRHIADYLRDEVLARVDEALTGFLFDTAILDRLHADLCEHVTGVHDAGDRLRELERLNMFVLPLDHRRLWYRYHPLFAEWLRLHPRPGLAERHHRAAVWLAAHDAPGDAVRHYVAAGDQQAAAELIERERWTLVGQGRQRTLEQWTRLLPDTTLRTRPRLTSAVAWVAYDAGRWRDVEHLVGLVEPDAVDDAEEAALLRAELAVLTAGRLLAQGHADEAGSRAASALELVHRREPRGRCGLLLILGKSRLAAGDLEDAARWFTEAAWLAEPFGLPIIVVIARCHLAEVARRHGHPGEAERLARDALEVADHAGLASHPETAVAHLVLANLHLDAGRVDDAAAAADVAEQLTRPVPYVPREQAVRDIGRRLSDARGSSHAGGHRADRLTAKEHEVLRLLPTSLTPQQIASELYVSLNTVKSHTRALYRKLGVHDRHGAIERARRENLL
jgi:LuxR family maltose regulon positive regulatory protein